MRSFLDQAEDFVVVGWDQAGAGKSYHALEPTSGLTVERMIDDTIELTNHLREPFDEDRIYILGESWGAALGILAARQHPELFHALHRFRADGRPAGKRPAPVPAGVGAHRADG